MYQVKRIAVLTMVRNDDFFLRKWVEYYGRELGKENLYIYYDGEDQTIADFCQGTNAFLHPKIGTQVVAAEKARLKFLSERAAELFAKGYDLVIGVDADEYIVVDPKLGIGLKEYLSQQNIDVSLSPLGLDFGQKLGEEGDLSHDSTFLSQRHYAQIGTRYTKPSIIAEPCRWGSGFHRVKGHNFHIAISFAGLFVDRAGFIRFKFNFHAAEHINIVTKTVKIDRNILRNIHLQRLIDSFEQQFRTAIAVRRINTIRKARIHFDPQIARHGDQFDLPIRID